MANPIATNTRRLGTIVVSIADVFLVFDEPKDVVFKRLLRLEDRRTPTDDGWRIIVPAGVSRIQEICVP